MDITFPDIPPVDPMDGDYLYFEAIADGQSVKCCIRFDALIPRSNNPRAVRSAFARRKEQIHATAQSLIEDGEIENGEILIESLETPPAFVEFHDVDPTVISARQALAFLATVSGESLTCIVPFEVLVGPASTDGVEAARVFQTQKGTLHQMVRKMIAAGQVSEDGEVIITTLA